MDLLWSLLVALPTVFVAAFLAVMLENLRERNRTRRWVLRNLRAMVVSAQTSPAEIWNDAEAAIQRWLDAKSPEDMDEDIWQRLHLAVNPYGPDMAPFLRSEAATSVSSELFAAVHQLEERGMEVQVVASKLNECFTRDVLPLWYERRVPLKGADARRVASFQHYIDAIRSATARLAHALERFRELVRRT
jgi:hypothetical protein